MQNTVGEEFKAADSLIKKIKRNLMAFVRCLLKVIAGNQNGEIYGWRGVGCSFVCNAPRCGRSSFQNPLF